MICGKVPDISSVVEVLVLVFRFLLFLFISLAEHAILVDWLAVVHLVLLLATQEVVVNLSIRV